jgi:hypothetical protein
MSRRSDRTFLMLPKAAEYGYPAQANTSSKHEPTPFAVARGKIPNDVPSASDTLILGMQKDWTSLGDWSNLKVSG